VEAYRKLDRIDDENGGRPRIDSLRASTHEALYRAGVRAWETERYEQVLRALEPIRDKPIGSAQDRLYYFGVAAARTNRSKLAVDVLLILMPKIDDQHPHYEAQAAYLLAELGTPDIAQRYAQLIARKHRNTIYYNSVVRNRLGNDQK
jgi:hypothetical protein